MPTIVHEPAADAGGFRIREDGDVIAEIVYQHLDEKRVSAHRTFVDDRLRGRGIAGQLVDALVAHAREHDWAIVPDCSYVARARAKRPEIADVIEAPAR